MIPDLDTDAAEGVAHAVRIAVARSISGFALGAGPLRAVAARVASSEQPDR
jgi:hypothetical protein